MSKTFKDIHKVLVMRCGALGDLVIATSLIDALRREYGEKVQIDWITTPVSAELFAKDKRINTLFTLKNRKLPIALSPKKQKLIKHAKEADYDMLINLEGGKHFAKLAKALKARIKIGAPYTTPQYDNERALHAVEYTKARYASAVKPKTLEKSLPSLMGSAFKKVQKRYALPAEYIVFNPSNSHAKKHKLNHRAWPVAHWKALLEKIPASSTVVIVGSKDEKAYFKAMKPFAPNVIDLVGKSSLSELVAIVKHAQLIVTTDTGPAHIASALNTPICVLMGPTPQSTAPYDHGKMPLISLSAGLSCAPCYKSDVMKNCSSNLCMELITPERVYTAIRPFLRT